MHGDFAINASRESTDVQPGQVKDGFCTFCHDRSPDKHIKNHDSLNRLKQLVIEQSYMGLT